MKAIAWLLLPLTLLLGIALAIPTPAHAQPPGDWHVIWEWTADADGAYQPLRAGAVYAVDGGIDHIALDGSASSGSTVRFDNLLLTPQSNNLRITIQYRTVSNASPRLRFGNPADTADFCQPTSGQFPIGQSSPWVTTTFDFSLCSLVVDQDYLFSLRNVGTSSDDWLIRSVTIESFFYIPPPPPPPPPPATWSTLSCALVIDTTSGAVISATQTLSNTPTLTNTSVITVSANLLQNSGVEETTNNTTPSHWRWDRPYYGPAQWVDNPAGGKMIAAAGVAEPTLVIRQDITQTLPAGDYLYGLDTAHSSGGDVVVRFGFVATSGGGGGGIIPFGLLSDPDQFDYSPTISNTWRTVTGTTDIAAGLRYLSVALPENDGSNQIALDNLFVLPVEADGAGGWRVRCATLGELYTTATLTPTIPPPITPIPPAGGTEALAAAAGGTCYNCNSPKGFLDAGQMAVWLTSLTDRGTYIHMFQVLVAAMSHWAIYIACVITNLVKCHMYAWIFSLQNAFFWVGGVAVSGVNGITTGLDTGLDWVSAGAQATLNWGAGVYLAGRDLLGMALAWGGGVIGNALNGFAYIAMQIGKIINPGNAIALLTSLGGVVLALVEFIVSPVLALVNIVVAIAETVWEVAAAVVNALTATPEDIDQWANSPDANINSDMIIVLLWIMGSVDHSLAVYHMIPAVYMVVGGMGLMAFKKWSEKWESILPI